MDTWPVKDAKARLSALIERAEAAGPQVITRHGRARAVVLSVAEYRKLEAARPDLKTYLLSGPAMDDPEAARPPDPPREADPTREADPAREAGPAREAEP